MAVQDGSDGDTARIGADRAAIGDRSDDRAARRSGYHTREVVRRAVVHVVVDALWTRDDIFRFGPRNSWISRFPGVVAGPYISSCPEGPWNTRSEPGRCSHRPIEFRASGARWNAPGEPAVPSGISLSPATHFEVGGPFTARRDPQLEPDAIRASAARIHPAFTGSPQYLNESPTA